MNIGIGRISRYAADIFINRIVVYHTRISYRTRMVHTVHVYAYGTTVRVWYGYLYHMRIAVLYYYCL